MRLSIFSIGWSDKVQTTPVGVPLQLYLLRFITLGPPRIVVMYEIKISFSTVRLPNSSSPTGNLTFAVDNEDDLIVDRLAILARPFVFTR